VPNQDKAPVWARQNAFPEKPSVKSQSDTGAFFVYGYVDTKGGEHGFDTIEELKTAIAKSRVGVDLAWSPESEYLVAPEEILEIQSKLWDRRKSWAKNDLEDGKKLSLLFLIVLIWYTYSAYSRTGDFMVALRVPTVGIAAILLLIFGLVPLYEGWKTLKKGAPKSTDDWQLEADESRFDAWLFRQKTPITLALLAVMVIVGVTQLFIEDLHMSWTQKSVGLAGLTKTPDTEWWRFVTAPFLHGNLLHWLMNAAALKYLARRVECLARWPHVIIVLAGSAMVGGIATYHFTDLPSVGASGGIMGLLGFLLVFEMLHTKLVPKPTRKRLLAGVVLTAIMGAMGFHFIDNAAHVGGLLAGMAYAVVVFPPSKSPHRPRIMKQDRLIASLGIAIILVGMIWTILKLNGLP